MRDDELALPDTSVVIHLLRMDGTGKAIEAAYSLTSRREHPLLSTIVEAEVFAIARYDHERWPARRVDELRRLLRAFVRVDVTYPNIVEAYIELY